jgi:putative flippase GtrA
MEKIIQFIQKYKQFITYGIIGSICVLIDFLVFTVLNVYFHVDYLYANVVSVHCGIISSFLLNRHFTFKVKDKVFSRFFVFYLVGLLGLLVGSGLLYLFVDILHLHNLLAKAIQIVLVAFLQFFLNKLVTFKQR